MPNTTARHPHDQAPTALLRSIGASSEPRLRRLVDQLVESRVHVVRELDLGDGLHALEGGADGEPDDALLAQRRVEHPVVAKLAREVHGAAEDAAEGNVLAEEQHAGVCPQGVREGGVDGLEEVLAGRGAVPGRGGELGVGEGRLG